MANRSLKSWQLPEKDLDFLVETASPEVTDKPRLKRVIQEDEDFRNSFVGEEKVFRRLVDNEEGFLKISPALFFEILLRRATKDLEGASYTVEKTTTMKIPVFDTREVANLLTKESLLLYLADMLASFTKFESYTLSIQIGKGIWEKVRFNGLDILNLMNFCEAVEDECQLALYKRIGDICLFMLGIFPEYAEREYRCSSSKQMGHQNRGKLKISPEGYEREGRRFYKLAAEHHSAKELDLSEIFLALYENFQEAKKPLSFIANHYLQINRPTFFV